MHHTVRNTTQLSLFLFLLLPVPVLAMPAITCHCFTDRSYDAARPAAADPYLLATTQNSFFAGVFNTDKKSIVIKKQQGTSSDDLWVAYWVASKAGLTPESLLQARQRQGAWKDVPAAVQFVRRDPGSRFSNALKAGLPSARLAETVVDELFLVHRLLPEAELAAVRKAGASSQELILATVIAARTGQAPRQVYLEVKGASKTWGALLTWANIDPRNMQQEVAAVLARQPR